MNDAYVARVEQSDVAGKLWRAGGEWTAGQEEFVLMARSERAAEVWSASTLGAAKWGRRDGARGGRYMDVRVDWDIVTAPKPAQTAMLRRLAAFAGHEGDGPEMTQVLKRMRAVFARHRAAYGKWRGQDPARLRDWLPGLAPGMAHFNYTG